MHLTSFNFILFLGFVSSSLIVSGQQANQTTIYLTTESHRTEEGFKGEVKQGDEICIKVEFIGKISRNLSSTFEEFPINGKVINASSCAKNEQTLAISFQTSGQITFNFQKNANYVLLSRISVLFNETKNDTYYSEKSKVIYKSPVGFTYTCTSSLDINLTNELAENITMKLSYMKFDVFREIAKDQYEPKYACVNDVRSNFGQVIPIVLASVLLSIALIMVIGYTVIQIRKKYNEYAEFL